MTDAGGVCGNVCVLVPTLNEAETISNLVKNFVSAGYRVLVIDGHSTDDTRKLAASAGAEVIVQTGKGKGQAVQQAFATINDEYLVMIDGDGTYLPGDIDAVLEPVLAGQADHVIGDRLANFSPGAFTKLNLIGNKIINRMFGLTYGESLKDILSGYRAFNKNAYKWIELDATGFEVETEITVECVKKDLRIVEVPITYLPRRKGAATKLNPVMDGARIGMTIFKLAKLYNPMIYFGMLGMLFMVSGIGVGIYVVNEWLHNVTHVPLTILATLLVIAGLQLFIFGSIANMIVALHYKTVREIRRNIMGDQ
ncbi:MAG: S-layer glycoprotein N-glycosyltransferase AglJ [Euryarchaeota archaeon]|nr:S-layer glycoprotein N-glycosyltransferase AglJ [Euryarchaeota archaeon]